MVELPLDGELLKLLASDTRREILVRLRERRMTLSELAKVLGLGKATISEHLRKLVDADLVRRHDDPDRMWVYHSLSARGLDLMEPRRVRFTFVWAAGLAALLVGIVLASIGVMLVADGPGPPAPGTDAAAPPEDGLFRLEAHDGNGTYLLRNAADGSIVLLEASGDQDLAFLRDRSVQDATRYFFVATSTGPPAPATSTTPYPAPGGAATTSTATVTYSWAPAPTTRTATPSPTSTAPPATWSPTATWASTATWSTTVPMMTRTTAPAATGSPTATMTTAPAATGSPTPTTTTHDFGGGPVPTETFDASSPVTTRASWPYEPGSTPPATSPGGAAPLPADATGTARQDPADSPDDRREASRVAPGGGLAGSQRGAQEASPPTPLLLVVAVALAVAAVPRRR